MFSEYKQGSFTYVFLEVETACKQTVLKFNKNFSMESGGGHKAYPKLSNHENLVTTGGERVSVFFKGASRGRSTMSGRPHIQEYMGTTNWPLWFILFFKKLRSCLST